MERERKEAERLLLRGRFEESLEASRRVLEARGVARAPREERVWASVVALQAAHEAGRAEEGVAACEAAWADERGGAPWAVQRVRVALMLWNGDAEGATAAVEACPTAGMGAAERADRLALLVDRCLLPRGMLARAEGAAAEADAAGDEDAARSARESIAEAKAVRESEEAKEEEKGKEMEGEAEEVAAAPAAPAAAPAAPPSAPLASRPWEEVVIEWAEALPGRVRTLWGKALPHLADTAAVARSVVIILLALVAVRKVLRLLGSVPALAWLSCELRRMLGTAVYGPAAPPS